MNNKIGKRYEENEYKVNIKRKRSYKETNEETKEETNEETNQSSEEEGLKVESINFTLKNFEGEEVSLEDFKGKPVVLNFWASWCGPCQSEMQDFLDVSKKYKDVVNFVMVNETDGGRETYETAKAYIEKNEYDFENILLDEEGVVGYTYQIPGLPTTFLIDSEGYIRGGYPGAIDKEILEDGIKDLLEKDKK